MSVLVVGAGAVGHVYAYNLQQGGAEVSFFCRPTQRDALLGGSRLYRLRSARGPLPQQLQVQAVLTRPEQVRERSWDQIWLTVPTHALAGDWLAELLAATGDATIVTLQPGPPELLGALRDVAPSRVVQGLITLIAYAAPLPGEERFPAPGWAWWRPPGTRAPLSGARDRVEPILQCLDRSDLPARRVAALGESSEVATAFLQCAVLALAAAEWSFDEVRQGPHLRRCAGAIREAITVQATAAGQPVPWSHLLAHPWALRTLLRTADALLPLPLETYLEVHFSKVAAQTLLLATHLAHVGHEHQIAMPNLSELLRANASPSSF